MNPLPLFPVAVCAWAAGFCAASSSQRHVRKIVLFHPHVEPGGCRDVVTRCGGRVVKEIPFINAVVCTFPRHRTAELTALAQDPRILFIEDDHPLQLAACFGCRRRASPPRRGPSQPFQPSQEVPWGVRRVRAPEVWAEGLRGTVPVAIVDTGVDLDHPDLVENLRGSINLLAPGRPAEDGNGHGTHVAGIVAAVDNSLGVVGVAPRAELYVAKAFDNTGRGQVSTIIEGLGWAVDQGVRVANLSAGSYMDSQALALAVQKAVAAGVTVVASAGNTGAAVLYPARYPEVISVAATTADDHLASFSSRGEGVTLSAPGDNILSTFRGGTYATMGGTSMAAPHVTGAVALLLQAEPDLTPADVKEILTDSAVSVPGLGPDGGAGLLDVLQAVRRVLGVHGGVRSR